MDGLFNGLFSSGLTQTINVVDFITCVGFSLVLGLIMAMAYRYKTLCSRSFLTTLAVLPSVVCVVIMMVNGNIGTGVAVAGAFSLVRFRSAPGSAKEIGAIFLAMGAGLICGMGYLMYALLFTILLCAITMLYARVNFGVRHNGSVERVMRVTIPENLNYTEVFNDIFDTYTTYHKLSKVKTTDMGSLFKLTYELTLKNANKEKEFIDELRTRNGNLEIMISEQLPGQTEL